MKEACCLSHGDPPGGESVRPFALKGSTPWYWRSPISALWSQDTERRVKHYWPNIMQRNIEGVFNKHPLSKHHQQVQKNIACMQETHLNEGNKYSSGFQIFRLDRGRVKAGYTVFSNLQWLLFSQCTQLSWIQISLSCPPIYINFILSHFFPFNFWFPSKYDCIFCFLKFFITSSFFFFISVDFMTVRMFCFSDHGICPIFFCADISKT